MADLTIAQMIKILEGIGHPGAVVLGLGHQGWPQRLSEGSFGLGRVLEDTGIFYPDGEPLPAAPAKLQKALLIVPKRSVNPLDILRSAGPY